MNALFGRGDDDFPYWLLAIRINILIVVACAALAVAWSLAPARLRLARAHWREIALVGALTILAAALRFALASANLLDHGGIPYSRVLLGYKGYFATAQVFSLGYRLSARDLEHAILFNRLAGVLTVPLVALLCRLIAPQQRALSGTAAFLLAVSPVHILFSASDALAIFSGFLCAAAYVLVAAAVRLGARSAIGSLCWIGGGTALALLTQIRYENALLLLPPALYLLHQRAVLTPRLPRVPLLAAAVFLAIYAYYTTTAGLSYQSPVDLRRGLQTVAEQLLLNPFMALPVLWIGAAALLVAAPWWVGASTVLAWLAALGLAVLTGDTGHSAARAYANWLVLLLPFSAYGFVWLWRSAPIGRAVAAIAVACLALQPWWLHRQLATQYLEMLEHQQFKALLEGLPPGVQTIVVPDDDLLRRQAHTTLEVMQKYAMIRAATPPAHAVRLIGLTQYLEDPQSADCAPDRCGFFFGLPCMEQDVYPFTKDECADLLATHAAALLHDATVVAAPFVDCAVAAGSVRRQRCDPTMRERHFAIYRLGS